MITGERDYDLVILTLVGGERIEATGGHPFYVHAQGWRDAERLAVGDRLYLQEKGSVRIKDIRREARNEAVYNLSVANTHTYYVGEDGVLVHNAKCYRRKFDKSREQEGKPPLPPEWDAHHRIPQKYRNHPGFDDFDFDDARNIRGVKGRMADVNVHQQITNEWRSFDRQNSNPSRKEIERFAEYIDSKYGHEFY